MMAGVCAVSKFSENSGLAAKATKSLAFPQRFFKSLPGNFDPLYLISTIAHHKGKVKLTLSLAIRSSRIFRLFSSITSPGES
jgi:hypothetical protein